MLQRPTERKTCSVREEKKITFRQARQIEKKKRDYQSEIVEIDSYHRRYSVIA